MANETIKRANEKAAKQQFQKLLSKIYSVDENRICITNRTTDVIMQLGDDENEWLYFELKCTTEEILSKNKKYFGAISMNQWNTYKEHPKNYYFVIAIEDANEKFKFTIISPSRIEKYLTGMYGHTDFSVSKDILGEVSKISIEDKLISIKENTFTDCLRDSEGKQKVIEKLHNTLNH